MAGMHSDHRQVRFGIAGFGLHAVKRLMPGFAASEHATVTALSRREAERARRSAEEYGIAHWFTSVGEMCEAPDVDAVLVTTPNASHLPDVLAAVKARKPVLVEKPMGLNPGECRQMINAAREANVRLGVAHVFRFTNAIARMRELVASRAIGPVVQARAEFSYFGVGHPRTWIADRAIGGGGPLVDVGVHCIDALRFILGDEVASVSAQAAQDEHSGDVEASAVATLRFRGGALGVVAASARAEYRTPIEIVGERGTLRAANAFSLQEEVSLELECHGREIRREPVENSAAFSRMLDAFALAVLGDGEFAIPGEEGLRNQLVLDAAYRSIAERRTVQLGPNAQ